MMVFVSLEQPPLFRVCLHCLAYEQAEERASGRLLISAHSDVPLALACSEGRERHLACRTCQGHEQSEIRSYREMRVVERVTQQQDKPMKRDYMWQRRRTIGETGRDRENRSAECY